MGFDDLARHMASRDRKKVPVGSADEVVSQAAKVSQRMGRTRDVILGLVLLIGGLGVLLLYVLVVLDAFHKTPRPLRPDSGRVRLRIYMRVAAGAAVIIGLMKLIRGLAGRSQ